MFAAGLFYDALQGLLRDMCLFLPMQLNADILEARENKDPLKESWEKYTLRKFSSGTGAL